MHSLGTRPRTRRRLRGALATHFTVLSVLTTTRRLDTFRYYACTTGPWFAIAMIPRRTDWEVVYDDRRTTALSYMGKPLLVWVVGDLQSVNAYVGVTEGSPVLRLCLQVKHTPDQMALNDIERIVHPRLSANLPTVFRAVSPEGVRGLEVRDNALS